MVRPRKTPERNADSEVREELVRLRRELQAECGDELERVDRYALEHFVVQVQQAKTLDLILPRDLTKAELVVADYTLRKLGATPQTAVWPDAHTLRVRIQDVLEVTHVGHDGLDAAAMTVLLCVHRRLLEGADQSIPPLLIRELGRWRLKALCGLVEARGKREAKRIELDVTADAPLAVCLGGVPAADVLVGGPRQRRVEVGPLNGLPKGCCGVFPETTRLSSKMWSFWCPRCDKKTPASHVEGSKRNPERELRNWLRSLHPVLR